MDSCSRLRCVASLLHTQHAGWVRRSHKHCQQIPTIRLLGPTCHKIALGDFHALQGVNNHDCCRQRGAASFPKNGCIWCMHDYIRAKCQYKLLGACLSRPRLHMHTFCMLSSGRASFWDAQPQLHKHTNCPVTGLAQSLRQL